MTTIFYDPSKERPFAREGDRIFMIGDTAVTMTAGSNDVPPELLTQLQEDAFFKALIEYKAIQISGQGVLPEMPPVTQQQPEIPPLSDQLKAAKQLRSP